MIHGSCLCGSVRYEIRGAFTRASHCHCSQCRKAHGAAFGSYADVRRADFIWLSGEQDVASYQSSPDVLRTFCRRCGATLQFIRTTKPDTFSLALGTLDSDPGLAPTHHIFVGSKAPWYEIADAMPQFDERPPRA